jgi:hypothetical protein
MKAVNFGMGVVFWGLVAQQGCGPIQKIGRPISEVQTNGDLQFGGVSLKPPLDGSVFRSSSQVQVLSDSDIRLKLAELDDLRETSAEDTTSKTGSKEDSESAKCFDEIFKVPIRAKGDAILIEAKVDFSKCLEVAEKPSTDTAPSSDAKFSTEAFFYFRCPGKDLSSYDGKDPMEIKFNPYDKKICAEPQILVNSKTNSSFSYEMDGERVTTNSTDYSSQWTTEKQPCQIKMDGNFVTIEPSCLIQTYSLTEITSMKADKKLTKNTNELSVRLQSLGLKSNPNARVGDFFESGSMAVTINNWTGRVDYFGPKREAMFSVSNGVTKLEGKLPFLGEGSAAALTKTGGVSMDAMKEIHSMRKRLIVP